MSHLPPLKERHSVPLNLRHQLCSSGIDLVLPSPAAVVLDVSGITCPPAHSPVHCYSHLIVMGVWVVQAVPGSVSTHVAQVLVAAAELETDLNKRNMGKKT